MADIYQNKLNQYIGDVARPTKFSICIMPPAELKLKANGNEYANGAISAPLEYFCSATKFPGATQEAIDFKYFGRNIPVPGITTPTQEWTATFYNDEQHGIRKFFLDWLDVYQHWTYREDKPKADIYKEQLPYLYIYQHDFALKNKTCAYILYGVFPTQIAEMDAQYSELNAVESFEVTFKYSYFDIHEIEKGATAESIKQEIKGAVNEMVNTVIQGIMGTLKAGVDNLAQDANAQFEKLSALYVGG